MTLNAEVSFDTFGKELSLLGVSFGSLFLRSLSVGDSYGLRRFVILRHDFLDLILS